MIKSVKNGQNPNKNISKYISVYLQKVIHKK